MSTAIQYGIIPDLDRVIVTKPPYEVVREAVKRLAHVRTDKAIAEELGRTPHRIYVIRKKLRLPKYRCDCDYLRPRRRNAQPRDQRGRWITRISK